MSIERVSRDILYGMDWCRLHLIGFESKICEAKRRIRPPCTCRFLTANCMHLKALRIKILLY